MIRLSRRDRFFDLNSTEIFTAYMPRTRKRKTVTRYEPETQPEDDYSSEELPSEVSSDCEIIEIDLTGSSEEEAMPCTIEDPPEEKSRSLVASSSPALREDGSTASTATSAPPDVVPVSAGQDRGPKRSVEFLCVICSTLNRFEALNCKYCNTLQRFVVCSHCLVTSDWQKTVKFNTMYSQ